MAPRVVAENFSIIRLYVYLAQSIMATQLVFDSDQISLLDLVLFNSSPIVNLPLPNLPGHQQLFKHG